jgi:predicted ATPase/DNA-binding SARP family transcriptional activator/class 3 adenylate cyclase
MAMSRLSLYLLGPPRIERDGKPIQVDTRKAIALLAYLSIAGEGQRRDALVNLLWPEYDQAHGRAALRRTLSALRKALTGSWLDVDREKVGLNPDASVWLDVDQFRSHLARCRRHGHPASEVCSTCLSLLTAAVALYRGDFLSGFGLRDSFNFDDWQFFQTEGLRRELAGALERLVQGHSAQGELETAIRYARQWLDLDRLNETAHGQLMLLYAWSGRRAAALRQYQECVHILESNLGVSPQASTAELYKAIVDGHVPAPPATPTLQRAETRARVHAPPPDRAGPALRQASPLPMEGEKRIVTVLYADMGRSLTMRGEVSLEAQASLADRFLRLVEDVLSKCGGCVEQPVGTGVLGVLGATQIHESDPELAIRAAIEIRREVQRLGLDVSVGINTGQVYWHRRPTPAGAVVDLAVRLAGKAQAGQILVGESTYRLARRAFAFTPLSLAIKGIEAPVAAYRVERLLPHPRKARGIEGLRAELIGRDWELAQLKGVFARVLQGGGQMVSLIGEAGVGKSRLVAELRESALASGDDRPVPLWLEGRCLDLGTPTSYAPFVDILREYLAWRPGEEVRRRRESIVSSLRRMVERGDLAEGRAREMGPLLGRLLAVRWGEEWDGRLDSENPEQIRHRTFIALYDFFIALSRQRPVVLVFEDLHWADTLSLDLISLLMEGLPLGPLLLLCVYRPEREHRCWHLATVAAQKCRERYTGLTLRELTHQQSRQMVASLLTIEALSPAVRERILSQSQGNPFFIEEVVRSLIDAGIVYREGEVWRARQEIVSLAIPESVQSVTLSRVDRLEERFKQALQVASVIGRVFRRRVLAHTLLQEVRGVGEAPPGTGAWSAEGRGMGAWSAEPREVGGVGERGVGETPPGTGAWSAEGWGTGAWGAEGGEAELEGILWALEERALIYQERAIPEVEYSFKHVLTQEAVYQNIPQRRRQALHRQVAEAIEALYRDSLDEYHEQLAHHYDRSGDAEKAVAYLFQAGEKARRSNANEEAIAHLSRGLELLETLPESADRDRRELDLLVVLGVPLVLTRGHAAPEVERTYARARALGEQVDDARQRFHALMGLRRFYLSRGEPGIAYDLGEQLLALAQSTCDPIYLSRAHMMQGEALHNLGEFTQAQEHCAQGLAFYDPQQHRSHAYFYGNDTGIGCRIIRAQALWYLGYPDQAARAADELIALARELSHPFTLVYALHLMSIVRQLRREAQAVQEQEETVIRISQEWGFALYLAWGTALRGWALAAQGREDEGIEQMRAGIAARRAVGGTALLPHLLASLAEACGQVEALSHLEEALGLAEGSGERFWEAELHRLKGELLLLQGEEQADAGACWGRAEACFQRALGVARRQQARSWELRAATSLGRLWQRQGRGAEARALLREIYSWFSEGFDTPDLKEASALLDVLA